MSHPPTLRIHTDGASRGNPGAAAYAYVITPDGAAPIEEAGCLGEMTNNQAEYTALVRALEHALELGPDHHLMVHSDSELLVKQMNGQYRVKNEELRGLYDEAQGLRKRFTGGVTIRHVRRSQNSRADELCNEALDGKRSPSPRPAPRTAAPQPGPALRDEALACLHGAAAAWRQGAGEPGAEQVWAELVRLLERRGVRLPPGSR
jgi:ribonuclease HI